MVKKITGFNMKEEITDFIEDIHKGLGVSKSQFVENCIEHYIDNHVSKEIKEKVKKIREIRESISTKEKVE